MNVDLIGRIEHGMTTAEDAVLVRRLMATLAQMMALVPCEADPRGFERAVMTLAEALSDGDA